MWLDAGRLRQSAYELLGLVSRATSDRCGRLSSLLRTGDGLSERDCGSVQPNSSIAITEDRFTLKASWPSFERDLVYCLSAEECVVIGV